MTTFGEVVYMINDLLKLSADDAFYTEEHILFLASKMRALLLERKHKQSRNGSYTPVDDEEKQEICLDLEPADLLSSGCAGGWLRSVQEVPNTLEFSDLNVYPVSSMLSTTITFIPEERMPFVGYNKWLKNFIYCAKGGDGHLYMHGKNPGFMFLKKIKADGVFADTAKAAALSCNTAEGESSACDILSKEFPLEDAMIPTLIEMVVQELSGARFAPQDKHNNAKDELGDANLNTRPVRAARDEERYQAKDKED